jgi:hypothetical protein
MCLVSRVGSGDANSRSSTAQNLNDSDGIILKFDCLFGHDKNSAASIALGNESTQSRGSLASLDMNYYYQCLKCLQYFDNTMDPTTEHRMSIMNEYFSNAIMTSTDHRKNTVSQEQAHQLGIELSNSQSLSFDDSFRSINLSERDSLLRQSNPDFIDALGDGVPSCASLSSISSAGSAVVSAAVSAPQSLSPAFINNAPIRQLRLQHRSRAAEDAHQHNIAHCTRSAEVRRSCIGSLFVEVVSARNISWEGEQITYSPIRPRTFNIISNYTHLPQNCRQAEFHTQTKYQLMDQQDHTVTWGEVFSMGTIYDLDVNVKLRLLADTTFLGIGKTTQYGHFEVLSAHCFSWRLFHDS